MWARSHLLPAEQVLWLRMSGADRRHSIAVTRAVEAQYEGEVPRPVMAASLLHDVGKIEADLGTYGRVVATLSASVAGVGASEDWIRAKGFTRRVGLYLQHPRLGGDLLEIAGSDPLTIAWTREHHLPENQWTLDVETGRVLKSCDDD